MYIVHIHTQREEKRGRKGERGKGGKGGREKGKRRYLNKVT
jgi:hypothetical protein